MSHFLCDLVVDDAGWPHKVMSNVMRLWSDPLAGQQFGEPRQEEWHSGPCTVTSQVVTPAETATISITVPERCVAMPEGEAKRKPCVARMARRPLASGLSRREQSSSLSQVLLSMPTTTSAVGWAARHADSEASKRLQKVSPAN